tara:strand:+ start:143 stop:436 length:294 start_codon:yes stop_codon:yes gene_type:complete
MASLETATCPECETVVEYDPDYADDPFDATEGTCVNCAVQGYSDAIWRFGIAPSVEEGRHDLTFVDEGVEKRLSLSTDVVESMVRVLAFYLESDSEE